MKACRATVPGWLAEFRFWRNSCDSCPSGFRCAQRYREWLRLGGKLTLCLVEQSCLSKLFHAVESAWYRIGRPPSRPGGKPSLTQFFVAKGCVVIAELGAAGGTNLLIPLILPVSIRRGSWGVVSAHGANETLGHHHSLSLKANVRNWVVCRISASGEKMVEAA